MQFSVVSTIFNEAKRLGDSINDLKSQSVQPAEFVITDAGSTDGTMEILLNWKSTSQVPVVILSKTKCNVAEGRNLAIKTARHDLIVSTDFGCRFHRDWLKSLTAPFVNKDVSVAGGNYTVDESKQTTLAAKAAYLLAGGYQIDVTEPWFIPSSRSIAYKKSVYDRVGGYCEWLTLAADDLVFGKEVLAHGYQIYKVPDAHVFWGRHTKANGFIKEAGRYGLGDGEAGVNLRNCISNLVLLAMRILFVAILILLVAYPPSQNIFIIALAAMLLPGFKPYIGYTRNWLKLKSDKYNFPVFLYGIYLLEATRLRYSKGYIRGMFNAAPAQKKEAKLLKQRLAAG